MPRGGRLLLVFAKAPEPGRAKTRLIPAIGAEAAADLQRRLIERTLSTASSAQDWSTELWCHPHCQAPGLVDAGARHGIALRPQTGRDLGERMHDAIASSLTRIEHAVLIGTDCPELSTEHLDEAFGALDGAADVVLGPAEDGGYYLIGLRRPAPELFSDVPWGTDAVLETTRHRIRALGLRLHELPALRDLDRPEDLRYFAALDELSRHTIDP
jgi:hypothetical protein